MIILGLYFTVESFVGKLPEEIKTGIDDSGRILSNEEETKEDINK
jgi:hypothetical protein